MTSPKKPRPRPFNAKAAAIVTLTAESWLLHEDVERHLAFCHVTYDYLGGKKQSGIDIQAYHPARGWLGVQPTTEKHRDDHLLELSRNDRLRNLWMLFGFRFQLWIYPDKDDRDAGDLTAVRIELSRKWFGLGEHELALPAWRPLTWDGKEPA